MRLVQRRLHKVMQPIPPWVRGTVAETGVPRTLLTNSSTYVMVRRPPSPPLNTGTIDFLHRLYQHSSANGIDGLTMDLPTGRHVCYDLEQEWKVILPEVDWIELVDKTINTVWRISMVYALRTGYETPTPRGMRFAVPLRAYTKVER